MSKVTRNNFLRFYLIQASLAKLDKMLRILNQHLLMYLLADLITRKIPE